MKRNLFLLLFILFMPAFQAQSGLQFNNTCEYPLNTSLCLSKDSLNMDEVYEGDEKSPWLAFFMSYIFPGLGQIYNGEIGKAFLFAGGFFAGAGAVILSVGSYSGDFESSTPIKPLFYSGLVIAGVSYLWSLIDAPVSASRINRERRSGVEIYSLKLESSPQELRGTLTIFF